MEKTCTIAFKQDVTAVSLITALHIQSYILTLQFIALHFQLSIANEGDDYDDQQFCYTPLLDEKRDADLLDLLPDYLTDDIEFPRHQVAKFYEKILNSMTRKIELEE